MGVLVRIASLSVCLACGACGYPRGPQLLIDAPAGATFRTPEGTFAPSRTIGTPFTATFAVGGSSAPYEFELQMPLEMARAYGASSAMTLGGELFVIRSSNDDDRVGLTVLFGDDSLRAIVSGAVREVRIVVPGTDGRDVPVARVVLRRINAGVPSSGGGPSAIN